MHPWFSKLLKYNFFHAFMITRYPYNGRLIGKRNDDCAIATVCGKYKYNKNAYLKNMPHCAFYIF